MIVKLDRFPRINIYNTNNENTGVLKYENFYKGNAFTLDNTIFLPEKAKINFWSYEANLAKKRRGSLIELIFFGLNYNAKRIRFFRKPYVLDLQKSHKIKVDETRVSQLKTKIFKRRILFWSYDRNKIKELIVLLQNKRPQNSYSGHGLIARDDKYAVKPGKIRQK